MRDPTLAAALERLVCDRCYVSWDASSTDRETASASALADPSLKTCQRIEEVRFYARRGRRALRVKKTGQRQRSLRAAIHCVG